MKPTNNCQAWRDARRYFNIEGESNLVLHHIDEALRTNNIERYNQWLPEDLVVLTQAEHTSLHHKGKGHTQNEETRKKISESLTGRKIDRDIVDKMAKGHQKKVQCVETGIIYASVKEAQEYFPCVRRALKLGCATKGLHFIYYKEI